MKNSTAALITAGVIGGAIWYYLRRRGGGSPLSGSLDGLGAKMTKEQQDAIKIARQQARLAKRKPKQNVARRPGRLLALAPESNAKLMAALGQAFPPLAVTQFFGGDFGNDTTKKTIPAYIERWLAQSLNVSGILKRLRKNDMIVAGGSAGGAADPWRIGGGYQTDPLYPPLLPPGVPTPLASVVPLLVVPAAAIGWGATVTKQRISETVAPPASIAEVVLPPPDVDALAGMIPQAERVSLVPASTVTRRTKYITGQQPDAVGTAEVVIVLPPVPVGADKRGGTFIDPDTLAPKVVSGTLPVAAATVSPDLMKWASAGEASMTSMPATSAPLFPPTVPTTGAIAAAGGVSAAAIAKVPSAIAINYAAFANAAAVVQAFDEFAKDNPSALAVLQAMADGNRLNPNEPDPTKRLTPLPNDGALGSLNNTEMAAYKVVDAVVGALKEELKPAIMGNVTMDIVKGWGVPTGMAFGDPKKGAPVISISSLSADTSAVILAAWATGPSVAELKTLGNNIMAFDITPQTRAAAALNASRMMSSLGGLAVKAIGDVYGGNQTIASLSKIAAAKMNSMKGVINAEYRSSLKAAPGSSGLPSGAGVKGEKVSAAQAKRMAVQAQRKADQAQRKADQAARKDAQQAAQAARKAGKPARQPRITKAQMPPMPSGPDTLSAAQAYDKAMKKTADLLNKWSRPPGEPQLGETIKAQIASSLVNSWMFSANTTGSPSMSSGVGFGLTTAESNALRAAWAPAVDAAAASYYNRLLAQAAGGAFGGSPTPGYATIAGSMPLFVAPDFSTPSPDTGGGGTPSAYPEYDAPVDIYPQEQFDITPPPRPQLEQTLSTQPVASMSLPTFSLPTFSAAMPSFAGLGMPPPPRKRPSLKIELPELKP